MLYTMLNNLKMFMYLIIAFVYDTSACSLGTGVTEANYRRQASRLPRSTNMIDQMPAQTRPSTTQSTLDLAALLNQTTTQNAADDYANRFTVQTTTEAVNYRTTPKRVSLEEECDYLAYYCLKAYKTGKVCGRTLYYNYQSFKNFCMLDYVNCMERYEVWQIVHMGDCFTVDPLKDYQHYEYHDDFFLDHVYVIQD